MAVAGLVSVFNAELYIFLHTVHLCRGLPVFILIIVLVHVAIFVKNSTQFYLKNYIKCYMDNF